MVSRRGMLEVTMVSASKLQNVAMLGKMDPYCVVFFLEREDAHENRQERRFQSGVERVV